MRQMGLVMIAATVLAVHAGVYAGTYSGGSGTTGNPYKISTVADWQALIATSGDWSKSFILTADLDFGGAAITPVGNEGTLFTGVMDGAGHSLSNLKINQPNSNYVGLFGYISGGQIQNLGVVNAQIQGNIHVGGLVGSNGSTITSCFTTGTVSGNRSVGGLAGSNMNTITSCYATGSVTGSDSLVGGLVGMNSSKISSCYATGTVSGSSLVGGLIGWTLRGMITSCYATGAVSGNSNVGGLAGGNDSGMISGCLWDTQTSGQTKGVGNGSSTGVAGKTTAEMKTQATYIVAGWDFIHTWVMPCEAYPHLLWENKAYAGGSGTAADPYRIQCVADWQLLINRPGDWGRQFLLMGNLDFGQAAITPVGNSSTPFTGVLDGGGHILSNLKIDQPNSDFMGLFGYVNGGQVRNLGVRNASITGRDYVGGLAATNDQGTITSCYVIGSVTGSGGTVGGFVGKNIGTITSCYANGSVSAVWGTVGGLVGHNAGTIHYGYATGPVTGGIQNVGGLVGFDSGAISGCFWDTQTSGQTTSAGGVGKTTAEMKTRATFTAAGWDFDTLWTICDRRDYPRLFWEGIQCHGFSGGTGTAEDPLRIGSVVDWQMLIEWSADWDKHFILTADIDFEGATITPVAPFREPTPENGFQGTPFVGVINGNGHTLSNLKIEPNSDYAGLFGCVGSGGKVKNLSVVNAIIKGRYNVGGVAAWNDHGTINSCSVAGTVSGDRYVGGLAGRNSGTISSCFAAGAVSGDQCVGGLVGHNSGTISSCYATGTVSGNQYVGGLVGQNYQGTITSCYATGAISGTNEVGGLVGNTISGLISSCFWDIRTSWITTSTGGTGKTTTEMKRQTTFISAGWDFVGESANGTADVWRMCRDGISYPRLSWEFSQGGDMACPDRVGMEDLAYLAGRWLASTPEEMGAADLNGDGRVDLEDFAILAAHWLEGT
jgi:mucin-19